MDFKRKILWFLMLLSLSLVVGCAGASKPADKAKPAVDINDTIGALAEVFASNPIPIKGYGLAGGLNGTGSAECPPQIRQYLEKYLQQHVSTEKVNIDELITSPDTAVVVVEGIIPPAASKNQRLDVRVIALPGTQTTSLENGWLYGADLYEARQFGMSVNALATAQGPVYIDSIDSSDARLGYILGGGTVLEDYKINLALRRPDYRLASLIRNRINERFGFETAVALTPGSVELRVPLKYMTEKGRFIQLVKATYLAENPQLAEKRIADNIQKLTASQYKGAGEIALEAIGIASLPRLAVLLDSPDPEIRLRAARCMLNLGDKRGLETLWSIASDKSSNYRIEAIEAIAGGASTQQAASMFKVLLKDDDFSVRLAAYEKLVIQNDPIASKTIIANSFYLDRITQTGKPAIFISRRYQARVALFGSPLYLRDNVFIESPDKTITINVPATENTATIIRKHPRRPDTILQLKSSLDLSDVILSLCKEPQTPPQRGGPGLGVSYSALVGLLKQLVDSGAVEADFYAGPLPKIAPSVKK